ncbi:MAG: S9 family peptidase [Prevotellaceae bacterium]|jgi:dipeptidyl aminopeptidase/acylaminoacyl peptidase|nr:S9 family peptidase [Prevotellaceae bacterium]
MKRIVPILLIALLCACDADKQQQNAVPMIEKKDIRIANRLMTPEVLWHFGRIGNVAVSPDGKNIAYTVTWYDIEQNASNSEIYIMDIDGNNKKQLTRTFERESVIQWRPDGEYIGFVRQGKLFEIKPDGNDEREIAGAGDYSINEFCYSPNGQKILMAIDTHVTNVLGKDLYKDLPKANAYTSNDLMYRHWDSWKDGSFTHLHIAEYSNGALNSIEDIMKDEPWDAPMKPFDDISETSWSNDGKLLAYSCKKLTGKDFAESTNSGIYLYNTETKTTELLTAGMDGYDKHPLFSPDGKKLLWLSMERAGFEADKDRIFIYDFETNAKTDCTKEFDANPSGAVWAKDGKSVYFTACFNETFRIFQMTLPQGAFKQLSKDGFFDYQNVQEIAGGFIATRTQITRPAEIYRIDAKTGEGTELSFVNKDILDQLDLPEMELQWVKTTDNKTMPMWVILPPKIDKSKQYPCILMCTGGPQGEVSQSYSYRWNFALMASQGYVVIYPARRGVSGYGQEWTDAVSKDHGGQPERDLLSAVDHISAQPWVDSERLGAVGASYGGFSIFWLAGNHNKRFKAFIAHCGIFHSESMYVTTEEMFFENWEMGGPFWEKENERTFAHSPSKFIKNWDTPILIFHGERDYRVPYTQGLAAFNAARMRNVPARLVVFPDATHWVLRPQDAILWQREFFAWMDKYLKK